MSVTDQARWFEDYADDLGQQNPSDVRLACAIWRKSEAKKMPTPGELLAKCRNLTKPNYVALPPPPNIRVPRDPIVVEGFEQLIADLKLRRMNDYRRLPGETDVDVARRLWPNREVKS